MNIYVCVCSHLTHIPLKPSKASFVFVGHIYACSSTVKFQYWSPPILLAPTTYTLSHDFIHIYIYKIFLVWFWVSFFFFFCFFAFLDTVELQEA